MTLAELIRTYVLNEIILPAQLNNRKFVIVRSGDVHEALCLENRMPAVCEAIDSKIFIQQCKIKLVARKGPKLSNTVEWVFEI